MMLVPVLLAVICGGLLVTSSANPVHHGPFRALRETGLFPVLNTITNTTFGVVRGALRVVNKPLVVAEDIILQLIEEIRTSMKSGRGIYGIPPVEPYEIDSIDFDVKHEIGDFQGNITNVVINGLSDFIVNYIKFELHGPELYLNLTFPTLIITGEYNLVGKISDLFKVFGDGPFTLKLTNFHVDTYSRLKVIPGLIQSRMFVKEMYASISLESLEPNFENFMGGDNEKALFYNKLIARVGPEAIQTLWPDLAPDIIPQIIEVVNDLLKNSAILRILNPLLALAQNLPINLAVQGG